MGTAAYNRGSNLISRQIEALMPSTDAQLIADLNTLARHPNAQRPFDAIHFVFDAVHNCWWAECPKTGFGYHYLTLRQAVAAWHVDIIGHYRDVYLAQPRN